MIKKNQLGAVGGKQRSNLIGLASADIQFRIGTRSMTDQSGCHGMAGRLCECAELIKRRIVSALSTQCNADQQRTGNRGV